MRKLGMTIALIGSLLAASGARNVSQAEEGGPRVWKWVLFISFCEYQCDPVNDPGGPEYCNCFQPA